MSNNKYIEDTKNKLRSDYQKIAALIPLKSSYYGMDQDIPNSNYVWYSLILFLTVVILAGLLTGFGAAAPVIGAIISMFSVVNTQIGFIALSIFSIYAIPWALVYIPAIGNKFRTWWEGNTSKLNVTAHSMALEKAHDILQMLYRKEIRLLEKKKIKTSKLDPKKALLELGSILNQDSDPITSKLGDKILEIANSKNSYAFVGKIFQLPYATNIRFSRSDENISNLDTLYKDYESSLNYYESNDSAYRTKSKIRAKALWSKIRKQDTNKSFYIYIANFFGLLLGWINALLANSTGTALAPLLITATLFMTYAPAAVMPFYLSLFFTILFGIAGFVAAYGLTKQSIEKSFNNIADFFLDNTKANRKAKMFKHSFLERPLSYMLYLNNKYSITPITMSLFLAIGIASFNFLAGVIVGHLILYPAMLTNPIAIASFSISSLSGLHAIELFFGIVGFSFTVIAVTPLMVNAWQGFIKSLTLEPLSQNKGIATVSFLASLVNTLLLARMLLRPGSPLNLFFGSTPMLISVISYVAPVCILLLGFALFYMGLKQMFADRGHGFKSIIEQNYHLSPDYTCTKNIAPEIISLFKPSLKDGATFISKQQPINNELPKGMK
ncbi:MAG: hypothetical protein VX835_03305 [Pseudomonadota bacterium]|nr:hypothetical protein [Pseudomonadota bacterium]